MKMFLAVLAGLTVASAASAELLAYEGFDLTASSELNGAGSGSGWSGGWYVLDGDGGWTIDSGSLTYPDLSTTGNKAQSLAGFKQLFRDFDSALLPATNELWFSFAEGNVDGQQFLSIYSGGQENIIVGVDGGAYIVKDWGDSTAGKTADSASAALQSTSMFVGMIDFTAGDVSLWVNPDLTQALGTADASRPLTDATILTGGATKIRFYNPDGDLQIDEIRFGTTATDVGVVVPEPASLALLGMGGLLMIRRRRV